MASSDATHSIHILEPTLNDPTGHCHSFIKSIAERADKGEFSLWAGSELDEDFYPTIRARAYFRRRWRRIQLFFLIRRLAKQGCPLFLSTCGSTELMILDYALPKDYPEKKVIAYFHWFRPNAKKLAFLKHFAKRRPNIQIVGPTESVTSVFLECGFKNSARIPYPYPRSRPESDPEPAAKCEKLLFAGAARSDKGFHHVINLLRHLRDTGEVIPAHIQCSPPHSGKYSDEVCKNLAELHELQYPALKLEEKTLDQREFTALFSSAITLQLYDRDDFRDRVSGVTLDSLSAGCPIICTKDTWIDRRISAYDAGIATSDFSAENITRLIHQIRSNFAEFSTNAIRAGKELSDEHNSAKLLSLLRSAKT